MQILHGQNMGSRNSGYLFLLCRMMGWKDVDWNEMKWNEIWNEMHGTTSCRHQPPCSNITDKHNPSVCLRPSVELGFFMVKNLDKKLYVHWNPPKRLSKTVLTSTLEYSHIVHLKGFSRVCLYRLCRESSPRVTKAVSHSLHLWGLFPETTHHETFIQHHSNGICLP